MVQTVLIVGQGYVGLPLSMRAVSAGFAVLGLDVDRTKVEMRARGRSYIEDLDGEELVPALVSRRDQLMANYTAVGSFGITVISVPIPLNVRLPDLRFIERSVADLAPRVRNGRTVILESTTYPRTTAEIVAPILEAGSGVQAGKDFHLGYSPERTDPGNPQWNLVSTAKIVLGIDEQSVAAVQASFDQIIDVTVPARLAGMCDSYSEDDVAGTQRRFGSPQVTVSVRRTASCDQVERR